MGAFGPRKASGLLADVFWLSCLLVVLVLVWVVSKRLLTR
jgi:hypothetical protein